MKLPDEVILHIWRCLSDLSGMESWEPAWTPFQIARVCCARRILALSNPSLWTSFWLGATRPDGTKPAFAKLKVQLSRSQDAPLSIHIRSLCTPEVLDLLTTQIHRWQKLTFRHSEYHQILSKMVQFYTNSSYKVTDSILTEVGISSDYVCDDDPLFQFFDPKTIWPNLTSFYLILGDLVPYNRLIPPSVRTVSLGSAIIQRSQLYAVLRQCPNIESLSVYSEVKDRTEPSDRYDVVLASLRALDTNSAVAIELCVLVAPNLSTLRLSSFQRNYEGMHFGPRPANSLTNLEFHLFWCKDAAVHQSLRSLFSIAPHLQSLILRDSKVCFEKDPVNCDFILSKACVSGVAESLQDLEIHYLTFSFTMLIDLTNKMTRNLVDRNPRVTLIGCSSIPPRRS